MVNYEDLRNNNISFEGPVRITYRKLNEYKIITKKLGLMDDFRVSRYINTEKFFATKSAMR